MARNPHVYIEDILESADLIEKYVDGVSKKEFLSDPGVQDKVIRRLEVIGEATKDISNDMKEDYPGIPWREIAGLRDVLSTIILELIWKEFGR